GEELAGSAEGLNLVDPHRDAGGATLAHEGLEKFTRRRAKAALALYEFEDHARDPVSARAEEIPQLGVGRARSQGLAAIEEREIVYGLAPGLPFAVVGTVGDLGHDAGTAVEAAAKRHDLRRRRLALPYDLQRGLVRLRPGVCDPSVTEPPPGVREQ